MIQMMIVLYLKLLITLPIGCYGFLIVVSTFISTINCVLRL
jgi:hypothetical protein